MDKINFRMTVKFINRRFFYFVDDYSYKENHPFFNNECTWQTRLYYSLDAVTDDLKMRAPIIDPPDNVIGELRKEFNFSALGVFLIKMDEFTVDSYADDEPYLVLGDNQSERYDF